MKWKFSMTTMNCFKMLNKFILIVFAATTLLASTANAAPDLANGGKKALACQVCHGKGGRSTDPTYPILAGQHAPYIEKQLKAFKTGTRKDPIMNGMAAPLSDQDIEDLAAFFHSNH
jgi:cytochrome c553